MLGVFVVKQGPIVCANPITVICPDTSPVMEPITELVLAHTVGQGLLNELVLLINPSILVGDQL